MAIQWSSQASGYMWLGIEVVQSPAAVSSSTSHVTLTVIYYVESDAYGHNFRSTLHRSGDITGDVAMSFYSATGATVRKEVARQTLTVPTAFGQWVSRTFSASLGPIWNGGAPSVSVTHWVSPRPYDHPATPTRPKASYASDSRIDVTWSVTSTEAAPVEQLRVERKSLTDPVWRRVANLGGSARAWTDTTVSANNLYTYRVASANATYQSGWSSAVYASTTPAAPTSVSAQKSADSSIVVSWANAAPYDGTGYTIWDNGTRVGTVTKKVLTFTHAGPDPKVTHTYTVTMSEHGLVSAHSVPSPTVQLLTSPAAPLLTAPLGVVAVDTWDATARWSHSSIDTTAQTRAQVRWRRVGTTAWTTKTVTSSEQSLRGMPADEGVSVEWQARTWGAYKSGQEAGASPWSPVGVYTPLARPTVSVSEVPTVVGTSTLTAHWAYAQARGAAQVSATVELLTNTGALVETRTVTGPTTSVALLTRLLDGTYWQVQVQVRSADGLVSDVDTKKFRVSYPLPPAPVVSPVWDETTGQVQVQVVNPAPTGAAPAAVANRLWRSVDDGATWEVMDTTVPVNTVVSDPHALSRGVTRYRCEAVSALPSSAVTEAQVDAASWAMWISGGPGLSTAVALPWDPVHSMSVDLAARDLVYLAGRTRPVELTGTHTTRQVQFSATLTDDEYQDVLALARLATMPGPFLWRDPMGRRVYGSLSGVSLPRALTGRWAVKGTVTEVDFQHDTL